MENLGKRYHLRVCWVTTALNCEYFAGGKRKIYHFICRFILMLFFNKENISKGDYCVWDCSLNKLEKEIHSIKIAASPAFLHHILLISSIQGQEILVNPIWQVEIIVTKLYLNEDSFIPHLNVNHLKSSPETVTEVLTNFNSC